MTTEQWLAVCFHSVFFPIFLISAILILIVSVNRTDVHKVHTWLFFLVLVVPYVQMIFSGLVIGNRLTLLDTTKIELRRLYKISHTASYLVLVLILMIHMYLLIFILNSVNLVCTTAKLFSEKTSNCSSHFVIAIGVSFTFILAPILFGTWSIYSVVYGHQITGMDKVLGAITIVSIVSLATYYIIVGAFYVILIVTLLIAVTDPDQKVLANQLTMVSSLMLLSATLSIGSTTFSFAGFLPDIVATLGGILMQISVLVLTWVVLWTYKSARRLEIQIIQSRVTCKGTS